MVSQDNLYPIQMLRLATCHTKLHHLQASHIWAQAPIQGDHAHPIQDLLTRVQDMGLASVSLGSMGLGSMGLGSVDLDSMGLGSVDLDSMGLGSVALGIKDLASVGLGMGMDMDMTMGMVMDMAMAMVMDMAMGMANMERSMEKNTERASILEAALAAATLIRESTKMLHTPILTGTCTN